MTNQESIINPEFKNDILNNIEKTGENAKAEIQKISEASQRKIDSQVRSAKFETVYGLIVSKKDRKKTMNEINEVRSELWKESLTKATSSSTATQGHAVQNL